MRVETSEQESLRIAHFSAGPHNGMSPTCVDCHYLLLHRLKVLEDKIEMLEASHE